jgi:hypothetical protein
MSSNVRIAALLCTASLALGACGDGGSSPTAPAPEPSASCTPAATVNLAVGQTQVLTAAQAACFQLAAGSGAEYALAGYDARGLEASRTGTAVGSLAEPSYTIADATYGGARSVAALPAAGAGRAPGSPHFQQSASSAVGEHTPFARTAPWREGERFSVMPIEGTEPAAARVVRVVGGRFVLAVLEKDEAGASRVLQQAAEALDFLNGSGVPLLQSSFPNGTPSTSAGSGQLLILATAWSTDRGAAATWSHEDANGVSSFVWLNLNLRPGRGEGFEMYDHASYRVKVLGHELTHAWQTAWLHREHGHGSPASAGWSVEGGADFVAMDLVRRFLGVGLASNWKWTEHLQPQEASVIFALEPVDARGRLTWGYYDASSLLRDLQARLMAAGMSPEAAMAEVSRGAVEGWHGADGDGGDAGLVERLRPRLGAGWDPAAAVLLWTATQAADDRTGNAALNNPTYYRVGDEDAGYGWKAAAEVRGGSGQRTTVAQVSGGSFFVRLRGGPVASTMTATGSSTDARWMIVRVK